MVEYMEKLSVAIIGGGAAGLMAAVQLDTDKFDITILEKNDRLGKKLLATGNGRCNLTNAVMGSDNYYCEIKQCEKKYFIDMVLGENPVEDTINAFNDMGLIVREKNGYYYPYSEQALSVLSTFVNRIKRNNIEVKYNQKVEDINIIRKEYDYVIVASGSNASHQINGETNGYQLAEQLGHSKTRLYPSLVQLRVEGEFFKAISGVRTQVNLGLYINDEHIYSEFGELQLTDYGISGIPTFQISRFVPPAIRKKKKVEVSIDFMPFIEDVEGFVVDRIKRLCKIDSVGDFFVGCINTKLIDTLLEEVGYNARESKKVSKYDFVNIINELKNFRVKVVESNPMKNAQVVRGGIKFEELTTSLESRLAENVFFIGEIVDVDGMCGGYNLQWAWSSAIAAAKMINESV